jgi:undecaprenyl-diphosphatase
LFRDKLHFIVFFTEGDVVMSGWAHLRKAYAWGFLALLCFVVVIIIVRNSSVAGFDLSVITEVQSLESDRLTVLMEGFSWIGSTIPVTLLTIASGLFLFLILKHRSELLLLIIVIGGSTVLNVMLKHVFRRDRPDLHRIVEEAGYGFPSGHSSAAMALYGVLIYLLWRHVNSRKGKAALVFIGVLMVLGIGLSRIYLGVHYPSDVMGGYLISGSWLAMCIELFRMFNKPKNAGGHTNETSR